MFCNQCEQTQHGTGCTEIGVCGKDPDVQSLQEILLYGVKGMAAYAHHARRLGKVDEGVDAFVEEALFATVNDPFDKGLALALRQKWPMMHKDYHHYAHQAHPKPGELWEWGGFGVRVFNLLTQDGTFDHGSKPGRATMTNVNHCLRRLRHEIESQKIESLAVPKLATGVGGLAWNEVRPLIEKHLGDLKIPVYLYWDFRPDIQAKESGG